MPPNAHDEFLTATLPALDLVYNLARRLVRDRGLVEDVVQETYMRAFEAWTSGRKPRRVEPWIATICLNIGRSVWRRASSRYEALSGDLPESTNEQDAESEAMREIQRQLVHQALWQLPEEQRVMITLMDLDGFTASQVAAITRTPRGTVLSRVHRGRKRLARILEQQVISREA